MAWCANSNDLESYLQIDLGAVRDLCSVETQGYVDRGFWTERYKIKYSTDSNTWSAVYEDNGFKVCMLIRQKVARHQFYLRLNKIYGIPSVLYFGNL